MTTTRTAPAAPTTPDPLALLLGLVLDDDGTRWGDVATDWQRDDALAVLDHRPAAVRLHFLTRPRGGSKTTDLAAVLLVVLLTQAPARTTSHAYARDRDQAALLMDALRALAHRSGLAGLLDLARGPRPSRALGRGWSWSPATPRAPTVICLTSWWPTSWHSGRPRGAHGRCGRRWSPACPSARTRGSWCSPRRATPLAGRRG